MHSTRRVLYTRGSTRGTPSSAGNKRAPASTASWASSCALASRKALYVKLGRTLLRAQQVEEALRNGEIIRVRTANLRRDQLLAHERDAHSSGGTCGPIVHR